MMETIETPGHGLGRRALIAGALALTAAGAAHAYPSKMAVRKGAAATRALTSLRQEVEFDAPPSRIYAALMSSKDFAAFTGMPATIEPAPGGHVSMFGGLVDGRNIELVPGKRIVQAWRPVEDFPSGVYSLVKFELSPTARGTKLVLDHTGFPTGHYDHLNEGWPQRYWAPLKAYLAKAK